MIPKIIHYCWLSGDPFPPLIERCINSWKEKLPDYEIKCWNMNNFDIHSVKFVEEACSLKKWAFAADYIRLYTLYTEGGIYLDSDVFVKKTFDDFLQYDFFSSIEYHNSLFKREGKNLVNSKGELISDLTIKVPGFGIQAAIMGGNKGNQFVQDCLNYYQNISFILPDKSLNNKIIAPNILAHVAIKYGFLFKNQMQSLSGKMLILPSEVFAASPALETSDSYAVHCCAGSWRDEQKTIFHRFYYLFKCKIKRWTMNKMWN